MSLSEILFGFDGRLARLAYFRYSVMVVGLLLAAAIPAYLLLLAFIPLGVAAFAVVFAAGIWMSAAVMVKRLHDIGLPGAHVAWIAALYLAARMSANANPVLAALFGVAAGASGLWLLFMPGQDADNAFGLA